MSASASPETLSSESHRRDADRASRLAVAWQHPESRMISPVGLLDQDLGIYRFRYVQNALETVDFRPFVGFPDLRAGYASTELFPFFQQRVMNPRRPDYTRFIDTLALDPGAEPWEQLARSGGKRLGDTIQLFPEPRVRSDGSTEGIFLVHGVRHVESEYDNLVQRRIDKLRHGDRLQLVADRGNPMNPGAVLVCTDDGNPLGWVPDLLLDHIELLQSFGSRSPDVSVEHVNGENSPYHYRVMARVVGDAPPGYVPFSGEKWRFLARPVSSNLIARTGDFCPESGIWGVVGNDDVTAPIAVGATMPPHMGRAVDWRLRDHL